MEKETTYQLSATRRPSLKKSFIRAQIVSIIATTIDFLSSLFFYQVIEIYYVTSTSLGSIIGAITSFTLGRNWAFVNKYGKIRKQAFRFIVISSFSIFANTTGVYFFKENFDIPFIASRMIVSIFIGVFFNFFMNRYFVFR